MGLLNMLEGSMQDVQRVKIMVVGFLIVVLTASCSRGPVVKNPTLVGAAGTITPYPDAVYTIHTGDQLDIKFFYNPELNETVTVRPDGRISLQLVQDVVASGKTPGDLSKELEEKYSPELLNPDVAVIVRTFTSHRIYIDGEVNQPGGIDLTGPMTVMQSVAYAGGLKSSARTNEIVVIRRGQGAKPMAIPIDLTKTIDGTNIGQDITLAPFDIVFVPRSTIANVNLWVQQYLRDAILVLPTEFVLYYAAINN
jgi:protein involved in polysaccharide export with SLBB domain